LFFSAVQDHYGFCLKEPQRNKTRGAVGAAHYNTVSNQQWNLSYCWGSTLKPESFQGHLFSQR